MSEINRDCDSLAFQEQGCVLLPEFISKDQVRSATLAIECVAAGGGLRGLVPASFDSSNRLVFLGSVDRLCDWVYDFMRSDLLRTLAEQFLGGPAMPLTASYICKYAKTGLQTPAHQDQATFETHFKGLPAISFWIALSDQTRESSPLEFSCPAPKTLLPHRVSELTSFEIVDCSSLQFNRAFVLNAGDAVVHHGLSVHRAHSNTSDRDRVTLILNFRLRQLTNKPLHTEARTARVLIGNPLASPQ
jgi:hypothetical protein